MQRCSQRNNPSPLNWIIEQARDVSELVVRLNKLTIDGLEIHFVFSMATDAFVIVAAMRMDEIHYEQSR
jgi:hypothetical protein